jgi:hypothetical protein
MKFLDIIVENSSIKESKLYAPAKKAYANPDTGITIQNKSAYHVIKDCALITINYLPLWTFGNYKNPFDDLKGKFQRKHIEEFVSSTEQNVMAKQLLLAILDKNGNSNSDKQEIDTSYKHDTVSSDPYGEYGAVAERESFVVATNNNSTTVDLLCKLFDVK